MPEYIILINPGHNRVYYNESKKISRAELILTLGGKEVFFKSICGVDYLGFFADSDPDEKMLEAIARLSFYFGIFRYEKGLLKPIGKGRKNYINPSIGTNLKYTGKTNELFTRTLINCAKMSGSFRDTPKISILDPAAGKGTSLFEGLLMGYDVSGIEIGARAAAEGVLYFKRFLETDKYKHTYKKERKGEYKAEIHSFEFSKDKRALKNGECGRLVFIAGDSAYTAGYFKKNSFHLIVGDLPYGVLHSNITNVKGVSRNPSELLLKCLPGWHTVLKPGGVIALSFNTYVISRAKIKDIMEDCGFSLLQGGVYEDFLHRVDRSIMRDAVFAIKN